MAAGVSDGGRLILVPVAACVATLVLVGCNGGTANSGRQTGAAAHTRTDHSQGTHKAAGPLTSHTRHDDNQAGNGPRRTDPPSLTVT